MRVGRGPRQETRSRLDSPCREVGEVAASRARDLGVGRSWKSRASGCRNEWGARVLTLKGAAGPKPQRGSRRVRGEGRAESSAGASVVRGRPFAGVEPAASDGKGPRLAARCVLSRVPLERGAGCRGQGEPLQTRGVQQIAFTASLQRDSHPPRGGGCGADPAAERAQF